MNAGDLSVGQRIKPFFSLWVFRKSRMIAPMAKPLRSG